MPRFLLLLHAENLRLFNPESKRVEQGGGYVWRALEADSEPAAVEVACSSLLHEPEFLEELWSEDASAIRVGAEEVHLLDGDADFEDENSGYVFYIEPAAEEP